jgi:hypothetical protein
MSSDVLRRLTEKKGKQLSKFLGIDSVPSTQLIANMQSRINNPLFKLSMTDYEDMCGNKMMIKMMSKVIGCEEKQLKKFCKYINVFAENIKSSPKSIKNKMKVTNSINASMRRGSLNVLPDDILDKIVKKYKTIFKIKYKLKDWISLKKLNWEMLSENPNAIDLLKANPKKIVWWRLSSNPSAIELLREKIEDDKDIDDDDQIIDTNPFNKIDWKWLSANRSDGAIELLKENQTKINWTWLSKNPHPYAIKLLKANPYNIDWDLLSGNPNPEAIELLKANQTKINWKWLSKNPHPYAIKLLKANPDNIDWDLLSENTNSEAIELLKANFDKINWYRLSLNPHPNAIKLLKANLNEIDWEWLSLNPNDEAIELLKNNKKNIDWSNLSANPAIFDEILE